MSDLIDRKEAIDALDRSKKIYFDRQVIIGAMKDIVRNLPSAQPEIIRCRDCKYWMPYDWMFSEVWKSKNMEDYPENEIGCAYADMSMSATDFCSRAERREVSK